MSREIKTIQDRSGNEVEVVLRAPRRKRRERPSEQTGARGAAGDSFASLKDLTKREDR